MMASRLFNLVFICPWPTPYWRKEWAVQFGNKIPEFIWKRGVITLACCFCFVAVSLLGLC